MARIFQLSPHLADLIAAGEVVERPGSVVKELVENSIDAGASRITVEIQNGGMTLIRVTDDGCGMERADAQTAFLRHATSKLRKEEDLAAIGTLGFRGEALAAISAVSRLRLLTCRKEDPEGTAVELEGGVILSCEPAGCPKGTTILVKDLFYNTPARLKFMKTDLAEGANVSSVLQHIAAAHPEIAFRLIRDGQEVLSTVGDGELLAAIYSIYGRQTAKEMIPVDNCWEKARVTGFVSKPTATRGNRTAQTFYVNGRYIKSKTLTAALEEAYRNRMMSGRFPFCVLNIQVPLTMVDVNVHPAKTEVRFIGEKAIFDCVYYGVLAALNGESGRKDMTLGERREEPEKKLAKAEVGGKQDFFRQMSAEEYRAMSELGKIAKPSPEAAELLQPKAAAAAQPRKPEEKTVPAKASEAPPARKEAPFVPKPGAIEREKTQLKEEDTPPQAAEPIREEAAEKIAEPEQITIPEKAAAIPEYRIVGEVLDSFFVVEEEGEVLFIDKHAAHERILFEKLKKQDNRAMSQQLLEPLSANLSREEAAAVLENIPLMEECGFDIQDFGDHTVLIRAIPDDLDPEEAESLLCSLAEGLMTGKNCDPSARRDALLHTIACKAAIKAGWHTEAEEREALVREVLSRDDLKYCPHGRPICIRLTEENLRHQFKRS